jgi:hypothetical protein
MVTVTRLSPWYLLVLFVVYLISHASIYVYLKHLQDEFKQNPKDKEKENIIKVMSVVFKWFPFIYVILLLLMLGI